MVLRVKAERRVPMAVQVLVDKMVQMERRAKAVLRDKVEPRVHRLRRVLRVLREITELAVLREVVVHLLPMVVVEPMAVVVQAELRVRRV